MHLKNDTVDLGTGARSTLLVIVHGMRGKRKRIEAAIEAIREEHPDFDVLAPSYGSGGLANTDPCAVAEKLSDSIERAFLERRRQGVDYRVILVGYSMGALIVRKAYVFARGLAEDSPYCLPGAERHWAKKVERIVLLAGMNRGWSHGYRPGSGLGNWLLGKFWQAITPLAKLLPICGLLKAAERGAPFVANLRIQWLNLERAPIDLPPTIQILGDEDSVVMPGDNADVMVCRDFRFLKIANTGHADILDFDAPEDGPLRRDRVLGAIGDPIDQIESDLKPYEPPPNPAQDIVFVAHGIRDYGNEWMAGLGRSIELRGMRYQRKVEVITPSYGYFPLSDFLFRIAEESTSRRGILALRS